MNRKEFLNLVDDTRSGKSGRLIVPVYRRLGADMLTPVSAFYLLRQDAGRPFLLESVEGGEKLARYSFLGRNPYMTVRSDGGTTMIERPGKPDEADPESIFDVLGRLLSEYTEVTVPNLPRLTCGAVGFMSYDVVRLLEHLPDAPEADIEIPTAMWCFYDTIAAFDHVKHQLVLMAGAFVDAETDPDAAFDEAVGRLDELEEAFSGPVRARSVGAMMSDYAGVSGDGGSVGLAAGGGSMGNSGGAPSVEAVSDFPEEAFKAAVEKAKHHIHEGDIFQVVLSRRFSAPFGGDPFQLYRALRQVNPSPYLFYLDFETFSLVGSSPEVLVRVEGERAELMPIAGTRPRGVNPAEDARLAEDLLADPKERAEHVMLVDLGRNDLGRVCKAGSVKVDRYAYIERYSHVMHIVSSVSGSLGPEYGPMDVLAACFPAGTVSGAPKVRAMEIIDSLEPTRRGPYAGAVGYLDFRGNMDTCITIRTMLVHGGRIYTQAGAGIVADSDPDAEYHETMNKARALHQAMEMVGG